ncbi:flagellar hook-basal body complex protein FliE [Jiella avicenniae]|uniref:Flagellar hook-basal body complex protein FliE n=1 Tax=Jiella avicenniae TaxID=2907202 RepID=A0A9X1NVY1_9HYPH|nr:flagellar hook-basal body complex protein FliE [Jiella avicenniae]MCE7026700.1 flagellar hook-basal body complex protein FliE [Jiella avicenniae]
MIPAIGSALPRVELSPSNNFVTGGVAQGGVEAGKSFGAVLTQLASDAVSTVKTAEATSIKGVNGESSTQAVVEAVMNAERTLQTAIAVRDKAVAAYLELSRMSI